MDAPLTNWNRFLADLRYEFVGHKTSNDLPGDHNFPLRSDSDQLLSLDFVMLGGAEADSEPVNYHQPVIYPLPARQLRVINLKLLELQAKVHELIPNIAHHPQTRKSLEEVFRQVRYEHHLIEEYTHRFRSSPTLMLLQSSGEYTQEGIEKIIQENHFDLERSAFYLSSISVYNEITFRHREMLSTCSKIARELQKAFGNNPTFADLTSFKLSASLVPVKDERQYQIRAHRVLFSEIGNLRGSYERLKNAERAPGSQDPVFPRERAFALLGRLSLINFQAYPELISKELKENIVFLLRELGEVSERMEEQSMYQKWALPLYLQLHLSIGPDISVKFMCYLTPAQMPEFICAGGLEQEFTIGQIERILNNLERIPKLDDKTIKFLMAIYKKLITEDPFADVKIEGLVSNKFCKSMSLLGRLISAKQNSPCEIPKELHMLTQPIDLLFADGPERDTLGRFLSLCLSSPVLHRWAFSGGFASTVLSKVVANPPIAIDLQKFELKKSIYFDLINFVMEYNRDSPELLAMVHFFGIPFTHYRDILGRKIWAPAYIFQLEEYPHLLSEALKEFPPDRYPSLVSTFIDYFKTINETNFPSEQQAFLGLYNQVKNAYGLVQQFQATRGSKVVVKDFAFAILHLLPLIIRQVKTFAEEELLEPIEAKEMLDEIYLFCEAAQLPKNSPFVHNFYTLMQKYKTVIEINNHHPLPELVSDLKNELIAMLSGERLHFGGIYLPQIEVCRRGDFEIQDMACQIQAAIDIPDVGFEVQVEVLRKFMTVINADSTCESFKRVSMPNFLHFYTAGLNLMKHLKLNYASKEIIPYKFVTALIDNQLHSPDFEKSLTPMIGVLSELHDQYKNAKGLQLEFLESHYPSIAELRIISRFVVDEMKLPNTWVSVYTTAEKAEIRSLFPKTKLSGI